jgi:hypothetical protein
MLQELREDLRLSCQPLHKVYRELQPLSTSQRELRPEELRIRSAQEELQEER